MNPLMTLSLAFVVVSILFTMNRVSAWFAPVICVCALLAVLWVLRGSRLQAARDCGDLGVDHAKLQAMNVAPLRGWLKEQVRGHGPVIDAFFSELERNLKLAKSGRPLGAFLLVGPTGTGKTFLARLIGEGLFPGSKPVVLSMNQYKLPQDVYTLLGPPPGVPGYEIGGTLTRPIRENPYRVVVLDELDKAHRDVQHCLYDILDVGHCLEKGTGRVIDFSGALFFGTSNAGVEALRAIRASKTGAAGWQAKSRDALAEAAGFDKAFLARWNGIYLLDELPPVHIAEVACLQLARYWKEYGIEVAYATPEMILAAVQGNEEFRQYGVRQLGVYLREMTREAVVTAKSQGASRVWLGVDEAGLVQVSPL